DRPGLTRARAASGEGHAQQQRRHAAHGRRIPGSDSSSALVRLAESRGEQRLAAEAPANLAAHVLHCLAPALLDRLARLAEQLELARSSTLDQVADPEPGQAKASVGEQPLGLELADDAPGGGEDLHGLRGRALERDLSGPGRERDVAQLDVDRAALLTGRGQSIGDPGGLAQQPVLDLGPGREVVMEGVLVADLLALASGRDLAIVEPEAQSMQVS